MPTHIEQELGLAPTTHRIKRWFSKLRPEAERSLDPLTVNYEAWRAMRRMVRSWPHYQEAPNFVEVLVSPEDWDDYWGVDTGRKESGVAAYVRACAADKGYWMAGDPQVVVDVDDTIDVGDVVVRCQFAEPANQEEPAPLVGTGTTSFAAQESGPLPPTVPPFLRQDAEVTTRLSADDVRRMQEERAPERPRPDEPAPAPATSPEPTPREPPTLRFMDESHDGVAFLVDDAEFRLEVHSGDCIGAVRWGEEVPPEVNVRLDAEGFPYVEGMQCTLAIRDGRWTVTNHATRGTRLTKCDGRRFMLGEPEACPIDEGDVLWLGPMRPLRFVLRA